MAVYTAITYALREEAELDRVLVKAHRLRACEQLTNRRAPLVAVVLGELVHVHPDEAIGETFVDPATELHRVLHPLLAIREPRTDRLAQDLRQVVQLLLAEVAPGDVDPERQRQTRLGEPPLAEIDRLCET